MTLADITSSIAATLTTFAFLPQALQVIRTRETKAISLGMYSIFTVGVAMWGVYGVLTMQWPIIIANLITFVLALGILVQKIRDVRAGR